MLRPWRQPVSRVTDKSADFEKMLMVDRSAFLPLQTTCLLEPLLSPATRNEKMTYGI